MTIKKAKQSPRNLRGGKAHEGKEGINRQIVNGPPSEKSKKNRRGGKNCHPKRLSLKILGQGEGVKRWSVIKHRGDSTKKREGKRRVKKNGPTNVKQKHKRLRMKMKTTSMVHSSAATRDEQDFKRRDRSNTKQKWAQNVSTRFCSEGEYAVRQGNG